MNKNNVDTIKQITHLSLCSGYEGIGIGLRAIFPTLRDIAYVEREGFPIANLVAKMETGEMDQAPIFTDVKTFPYRKFRGCVDILSGGFPCQPFSAAGKRQATEDPRHLFPYIADGIKECQPRIVFLENVQGILSCKTADGEPVLQYVLRKLEGLGYKATAGIFSAEEVGAPHQRKRVYILGMANSERGRMRGGRNSQECRDDPKWIQSNEGERNELRGEVEGFSNSSREELGNAKGGCNGLNQTKRQGRNTISPSSQELVNTNSNGYSEHSTTKKKESIRRSETSTLPRSKSITELANNSSEGLESDSRNELEKAESQRKAKGNERRTSFGGLSRRVWPARPSQRQHEWEEPRVTNVGNSKGKPSSSKNNGRKPSASSDQGQIESRGGNSGSLRKSDGQVESRLGGTTDGIANRVDATANRVDRLRLCGNGVVPQTATKAFLTLINRIQ
tara:strand:+ start:620 stop:1969 length:1350 start_codon:yes stop_codon:yes gene_type:complete